MKERMLLMFRENFHDRFEGGFLLGSRLRITGRNNFMFENKRLLFQTAVACADSGAEIHHLSGGFDLHVIQYVGGPSTD